MQKRYPCCIMGTCCVPWDGGGRLDEPVFRRHIRSLLEKGTAHLYIFGTAGEGYAVSDAQFDRITTVFTEEMRAGGAEPMVGVISPSLSTVIGRIERACERGVRHFQVSLPGWGACTPEETFAFFRETCGRFPDCRFMHYNLVRAGRLVEPAEYMDLADAFENFVAVKAGIDSVRYLWELGHRPSGLRFFLTEMNFAAARLMGLDVGLLISLASINWERAHRFYQAGVEGRFEELRGYTWELLGIRDAMKRAVGEAVHMDGGFDKMFARIDQPDFSLRLLPPYEGASDEGFARFVQELREKHPNWAT